jgi:hypothetical protein
MRGIRDNQKWLFLPDKHSPIHAYRLLQSSPLFFSGVRVTRSLVLYVYFVGHCLSFCPFSFGHCVVCSSSIYEFWSLRWYLKNLIIKILLQGSLEFSCYSIFLSYSVWHWRYLVYLWWFLLFQLICKIS